MSQIETKIGVRVDINDGKIFLEGQGHWVKGQGQIWDLKKKCSAYKLNYVGCIGTKTKINVQYDNVNSWYQAQGYPLVCWSVCT